MLPNTDRRGLLAAAVVLVVVIAALFHPLLLAGKVMSANDTAYQYPPFSLDPPAGFVRPGNYLLADQAQQFYCWFSFLKENVLQGIWPRWLPHILCGQQFAVEFQSQSCYPPNLLILFMPIPVALTLINMAELFAAGFGMVLFLRRFRVSVGASLLGAVAYMLCSYNVNWLNHPHASVSAFLPLFLWSCDRVLSGSPRISLSMAACATLAYLLISGGHPNTAILSFFLAGLFVLFRCAIRQPGDPPGRRAWKRVLALAAAVLLGIGLAGVLLVPFVEARLSGDFFFGNRLGAAFRVPPPPLRSFRVLLLPRMFGTPMTWNDGNVYNYIENGLFVGVTTLLVAVAGLPWAVRRPLYGFFGGVILLVLMTLLGVEPVSGIVRHIPVLRDNHIQRITLLMQFSMAVCGAVAWDAILTRPDAGRPNGRRWFVALLVILAAGIALAGRGLWKLQGGIAFLATMLGAMIIVGGAAWRPAWRKAAVLLACVLLSAELLWAHRGANPFLPLDEAVLKEPAISRQMKETAANQWFRMAAIDMTFVPNLGMPFQLADIRGYSIPTVDRYVRFLARAFYGGKWPYDLGYWGCGEAFSNPENQRWIDLMGVRFILRENRGRMEVRENPGAYPHVFWLTNAAPSTGRIDDDVECVRTGGVMVAEVPVGTVLPPDGAGPIREIRRTANQVDVEVQATEPAILVLNEMPLRGWRATVDDRPQPVLPVNIIQTGVKMPAGSHVVKFNYLPASFVAGAALSVGSLVLLLSLLLWRPRRARPAEAC